MKYPSPYHKIILRDKGTFIGNNFIISTDSINWIPILTLIITNEGQLISVDENQSHYVLLKSLQSCYVQIYPTAPTTLQQQQQQQQQEQQTTSTRRKLLSSKKSNNNHAIGGGGGNGGSSDDNEDSPPVIFIKSFENDKLYIKIPSRSNFGCLLSTLIVWQNLKPEGLGKKWYCENKSEQRPTQSELLVCRFKVFGPIPLKHKNLNIVAGPKAPIYQPKIDDKNGLDSHSQTQLANSDSINEGWFYAMGALNSSGILNFISELDGTLLYSIDIKSIMSSEIREIHHSIFNNSNVLFIGILKELRHNNNSNMLRSSIGGDIQYNFLTRDGKIIPNNQRILIEFPLHIDLEDWFVGLNYFAKREYIGSFGPDTKFIGKENTEPVGVVPIPPKLDEFTKEYFRVSKKVSIDIIEAKFDQENNPTRSEGKIYAEVRMWGYPWSRTVAVNHTLNPFWKEEFSTDLPISTQMIHILIKKSTYSNINYSNTDKIIGTVYVTPDVLIKEVGSNSTIMATSALDSTSNSDIVRLTIYDTNNLPIGKLLVKAKLKECHILPPNQFKPLENMLINAPMKPLIKFCNERIPPQELERYSVILLDIFQCLGVEEKWFKSLMEFELVNVDKITRRSYYHQSKRNSEEKPKVLATQHNVFNTLFRGSSIFSKSLEKYNLRIGQEYLEKVFGDFFAKLNQENKNCEVDPRYVRLQERAERRGKSMYLDGEAEDDDDSDSDSDVDSDTEQAREIKIKQMIETNYNNLYNYSEELWNKIYTTSNDLPRQIKTQLANFRNKVELNCEPDDKTTSLNCLSAFIFLRFFCPAILNPKLFYLTENHQTGSIQRTLTLLAKVLLNLANRTEFSIHKEPYMTKMNTFLQKHQSEIYDYFDKITGRKNDFNPKILDLSHEVKRFDLGLDKSKSDELPTTPYLIDKCLRLTEIIHLLDYSKYQGSPVVSSQVASSISSSLDLNRQNGINQLRPNSDISINEAKNVYKIGSLEFEKSEFLELTGDAETEGFIKSLCGSGSTEDIFSFIKSNITLKDIQKQSMKLMMKIKQLENYLDSPEYCKNYKSEKLWEAFTYDILNRCYLDTNRNCLVSIMDPTLNHGSGNNYKKLTDHHSLSHLKLKFPQQSTGSTIDSGGTNGNGNNGFGNEIGSRVSMSFSAHSLGSFAKQNNSKNPFKKWLRKS
ncbi:BUD2 [[Candida] subhashii]|uniref:BUD2 n=1 Tax=[Candida] subhashii TaxID=561895 RepID=A0A8J5QN15_9ASCO|nr:BUD2 [[Candida] subhashii]KAG7663506.1 BUD2 [[Candida] subhashii]